jgi:hypothetical protein
MKAKVVGLGWTGAPLVEGEPYMVEEGAVVEGPRKGIWRKGEDPISRMRKYDPDGYRAFVEKRTAAIRARWERRTLLGIRRKKKVKG